MERAVSKKDFPSELLVAEDGTITGKRGNFSISIRLRPFTYDGETVDRTLELSSVRLPAARVEDLANKSLKFPANPSPGYLEASLYLWSVHNPIDVLAIRFGVIRANEIEAEFSLRFAFDYEGPCNPLVKVLRVMLAVG
jgi:hypothetical protein